ASTYVQDDRQPWMRLREPSPLDLRCASQLVEQELMVASEVLEQPAYPSKGHDGPLPGTSAKRRLLVVSGEERADRSCSPAMNAGGRSGEIIPQQDFAQEIGGVHTAVEE